MTILALALGACCLVFLAQAMYWCRRAARLAELCSGTCTPHEAGYRAMAAARVQFGIKAQVPKPPYPNPFDPAGPADFKDWMDWWNGVRDANHDYFFPLSPRSIHETIPDRRLAPRVAR